MKRTFAIVTGLAALVAAVGVFIGRPKAVDAKMRAPATIHGRAPASLNQCTIRTTHTATSVALEATAQGTPAFGPAHYIIKWGDGLTEDLLRGRPPPVDDRGRTAAYQVERWGIPSSGRVGGYLGFGYGAAGSMAGRNCGCN
jgi:hypothetical protein